MYKNLKNLDYYPFNHAVMTQTFNYDHESTSLDMVSSEETFKGTEFPTLEEFNRAESDDQNIGFIWKLIFGRYTSSSSLSTPSSASSLSTPSASSS